MTRRRDAHGLHGGAALRLCLFVLLFTVAVTAQSSSDLGVERLDPALDALIASGTTPELLIGDYFGLLEGPVWVRDGEYLLFSDLAANRIYKWTPDGQLSTFLDRSGFIGTDSSRAGFELNNGRLQVIVLGSNGITIDPQGHVVFCAHGDRAVNRIEQDGRITVLAEQFEGKRFSGPNDLVYRSDGVLYFTDHWAGLRGGPTSPDRELSYDAVFMLKDGKLQLLEKQPPEAPYVNGLALSPDERYLYVGAGADILRYDVQRDGTLTNRDVVLTTHRADGGAGHTDGMKLDVEGNIYVTGPDGVWIVAPDGRHLGTIQFPSVANVAFGDADGKTLYIMARRDLYRIRPRSAATCPAQHLTDSAEEMG